MINEFILLYCCRGNEIATTLKYLSMKSLRLNLMIMIQVHTEDINLPIKKDAILLNVLLLPHFSLILCILRMCLDSMVSS